MQASIAEIRKSKRLFADGGRVHQKLRALKASRRKQTKRETES